MLFQSRILRYSLVALLASLALAGLYFYFMTRIAVTVVHPSRGPAVEAVYATGVVEPVNWAKVGPLIAGRLAEIHVTEGQRVAKGKVLARLDDREARANVAQLAARAEFLQTELARQADLLKKNFISRQNYDRTASELLQAQAALAAARKPLAEMALIAPMDGVVLRKDGEIGESVFANQTLFWVGDPGRLWITAEVDEEDIARVKPGQRVLIKADAFPGEVLQGTVGEITPKGDPINKSYRVRVALPGNTPLRIGMTTEVNIVAREETAALLAPSGAVSDGRVWVVREGKARQVEIKTGIVGHQVTEIVAGLSEKDDVIINPPAGLKEGQSVSIKSRGGR